MSAKIGIHLCDWIWNRRMSRSMRHYNTITTSIWHPHGYTQKFNRCFYVCEVSLLLPVAAASIFPPILKLASHAVWFQSLISSLRLIPNSPWLRHSIIFLITGFVRECVCVYVSAFVTLFSRLSLTWLTEQLFSSCLLYVVFLFLVAHLIFFILSLRVLHSSFLLVTFLLNWAGRAGVLYALPFIARKTYTLRSNHHTHYFINVRIIEHDFGIFAI